MTASLPARFLDAFLKSFTHTFRELLVHGVVAAAALIYGLKNGHPGEIIVPFIWAVCFEVAWHGFKAAWLLDREIASNASRAQVSTIISQYGKPFDLPTQRVPLYKAKVLGLAITVAIGCLIFAFLGWKAASPSEPTAVPPATAGVPPVAIFADCEMTALPVTIAPQSSLHVVSLNKKFMLTQNWGLADIPNRSDTQLEWPSKEVMESEKKKHKADKHYLNGGVFGYKCDVSNHGEVGVFDLAMTLTFWYGEQVGNDNVKYTPILSPLDAGSHFVFYVFNDCPVTVAGVLPDSVAVTVAGDSTRRTVPLHLPHRTPIEPIMMFFPSQTQWVRQQPCE